MNSAVAIWGIAALSIGGVILQPWRLPEAIWAVAGAGLLVVSGLLAPRDAAAGIAKGTDVYLFLTGMMLLAELARRENLFGWLAAHAANLAKGSAARLFMLVYLAGTVVTTFMSNDATAVVLTPAVAAVARTAGVANPLPYLVACAFIANAASFVLPISNPANLVIYGSHMPSLIAWTLQFALPSVLSICATYGVLRLTQRAALRQPIAAEVQIPKLPNGGYVAAVGILVTAVMLMAASTMDWRLGLPTCLAGLVTSGAVLVVSWSSPWHLARDISWGVLPLVGGLFVLVEAVDRTGVIRMAGELLGGLARQSSAEAAWVSGAAVGFGCNVLNNLPAGLMAGMAVQSAHTSPVVTGAVLIGVDLGPNLAVTGSLATILWLGVLRREGLSVGAGAFLRLGVLVMPPALLLSLAALVLISK